MVNKQKEALLKVIESGYKVVDGNVINPDGQLRMLRIDTRGYYVFSMKINGVSHALNVDVHRLVAYQKYGDELFEKGIEVRHLDGDKLNNSPDNIALGTHSQNMMDIPKEQRLNISINAARKNRRFNDNDMMNIRMDHEKLKSYKKVMNKWGITSKGTLHYILNTKYVT